MKAEIADLRAALAAKVEAQVPGGDEPVTKAARELLNCLDGLPIDTDEASAEQLTAFDRTRSRLQKALAATQQAEAAGDESVMRSLIEDAVANPKSPEGYIKFALSYFAKCIAAQQAAPVAQEGSARAALRKLCDQLEGMKHTMFLMPGTGQHYSYWLREDASFYVEEARKFLAAPVSAAPTATAEPVAWAAKCVDGSGYGNVLHSTREASESHTKGNGPLAPKYEIVGMVEVSAMRAEDARDGARFRWLNEDHDNAEVRDQARSLASRLGTSSYFAITRDIDAAMAAQQGSTQVAAIANPKEGA